MNRYKASLVASILGIMYGSGTYLTMDSYLTFLRMPDIEGLFDPCRFFVGPLCASYGCLYFLHNSNWNEEIALYRQFSWKLGFSSFLFIVFYYSTLFVYPTELVCTLYHKKSFHVADHFLLAAPCTLLFMCIMETVGANQRFREMR